ncbi:MAG: pre-peptidase, partial [Phycisphaerae bacterium]
MTVSEKGDTASVRIADNLLPGIYHLRFFNTHGASSLKSFVVSRLPESEEKEPNNRLAEANAVPESGGVANGILQEAGDVDTYAILLRKGQTVVGSMLAHRELNSPMDATLQLLNPRGTLMEQNDD